MADTPTAVEVNCETGEVTTRELTADEIAAQAASAAQAQADADAKAQAAADFQAQLAATNAKLEALGLTAQDISVLLNAAKA